jgi:hypothetical protein
MVVVDALFFIFESQPWLHCFLARNSSEFAGNTLPDIPQADTLALSQVLQPGPEVFTVDYVKCDFAQDKNKALQGFCGFAGL